MKELRLFLTLLLVCCTISRVSAQDGRLEPKPASEDELAVIKRGADLNDEGKYGDAIEEFNKVLVKNPDCVQVMYEMANTYYAKGDSKKSMEFADKGLKYKSQYLPLFYVLEGSIEDDNKNPDGAIADYKKAIAVSPKFQSAYFNLGITLRRMGKTEEALDNLKQSVKLKPEHSSSNLQIADIYRMRNQKIPAFMAYMSYLYFADDEDKRIPRVIEELRKLAGGGEKNASGGMNISLSMDSTEGNFFGSELMMGLDAASDLDKAIDSANKTQTTPFEKEIHRYNMIIRSIYVDASKYVDPSKEHHEGFAMQFYAPFLRSMQESGNTDTYCHIIGIRIDKEEAKEWFDKHTDDFKKYWAWEKEYYSKK